MPLYPAAKHRLIPPGSNDPPIKSRIGVLHVDAGDAESLFEWFKHKSGGIESHFHIPKVKQIEQYRDTDFEADANHLANGFAISVETQGLALEKWNDKQLRDIKDLMIWLDATGEVPLRIAESWNDPKGGWGYHVEFGSPGPWTPSVKSCPGPWRIKQWNEILVPWIRKQEDMAFTDEDRKKLNLVVKQVTELNTKLANQHKSNGSRFRRLRDLILSDKP